MHCARSDAIPNRSRSSFSFSFSHHFGRIRRDSSKPRTRKIKRTRTNCDRSASKLQTFIRLWRTELQLLSATAPTLREFDFNNPKLTREMIRLKYKCEAFIAPNVQLPPALVAEFRAQTERRIFRHAIQYRQQSFSITRREPAMKGKRLRAARVVPPRAQSPRSDRSPSARSKSTREYLRPASISRMRTFIRARRSTNCGSSCARKNSANSRFSSAVSSAASFFNSASDISQTQRIFLIQSTRPFDHSKSGADHD